MDLAKRNYGIDLLRLVAMFLVVVLHVLGQGGVLANVRGGGIKLRGFWKQLLTVRLTAMRSSAVM